MKTNKQKGFIVPVLIAIVALLIIGGGVYIYSNKKINCISEGGVIGANNKGLICCEGLVNQPVDYSNSGTVTKCGKPSESNQISITTLQKDWKTYTNTQFGFEVKYPSDWYVDDNLTLNTCCLNITSYNTGAEKLFAGQTMIQVQKYTKPALQSLVVFVSLPDKLTGTSPKVETVTVAGLQGVESNELSDSIYGDSAYYLPKSETEGIKVMLWSHPDTRQSSQIFAQQILSTFKFTNSSCVAGRIINGVCYGSNDSGKPATSADVTKDWKTYTNTQFGFEVKYPSTWKYKAFDYNVEGIAFCPPNISDCGAQGGGGSVTATIIISPFKYDMTGNIIGNSATHYNFAKQNGGIFAAARLSDTKYQAEFNQILSTFKFTN